MEPIKIEYPKGGAIYGARPDDFKGYDTDEVRKVAQLSCDRFVAENAHYLHGRILDYGAGKPGTCRKPQPYRALCELRGEYIPYDLGDSMPWGGSDVRDEYDSILCTQVLAYVPTPLEVLRAFGQHLRTDGALVMTYTVNWEEIETEATHFTKLGVARMIARAGLSVLIHERLSEVKIDGVISFPLMNGIVCRK